MVCIAFLFGTAVGVLVTATAQPAVPGPGERVTGIGGVFMRARDPGTLSAWYRDRMGIALADGAPFSPFRWREQDNSSKAGMEVEPKVVEHFNGRFAWAVDREGNRIELWEPKAGY